MFSKKGFFIFVSLLLMLTLIVPFGAIGAFAASDFIIENGVLVEYKGNSKTVTVPSEVYRIGDSAFEGNTTVKTVELNNVAIIGNSAFRNCTALKTVKEYDNVSSCGAFAFNGTPFLEDSEHQDLVMGSVLVNSKATGVYTVPSHIKSIAPYAFTGNTKLTSISIGEGVMSIGEGSFYNCTALKTVNVSSSVSYIGAYVFNGTKFISSVTDEFLVMGNGILVRANTAKENVTIPADIRQIGGGAFAQNKTLKTVTIPDSVSGIGKRAFAECSALEKAELPASVVSVESEAFNNCTALKSVIIPETVKSLGESVYLGCTALKTAKVYTNAPLSVGLFAGCTKLEKVLITMNPEYIMSYAFYGCTKLSEMSIPSTVSFVAENAFEGCSKLSVWCDSNEYPGTRLKALGVKVSEVGDVNSDGKLNVRDSTHIRKSIAGLVELDFSAELKGDTDFNGVINVRDATKIQKKLVGVE